MSKEKLSLHGSKSQTNTMHAIIVEKDGSFISQYTFERQELVLNLGEQIAQKVFEATNEPENFQINGEQATIAVEIESGKSATAIIKLNNLNANVNKRSYSIEYQSGSNNIVKDFSSGGICLREKILPISRHEEQTQTVSVQTSASSPSQSPASPKAEILQHTMLASDRADTRLATPFLQAANLDVSAKQELAVLMNNSDHEAILAKNDPKHKDETLVHTKLPPPPITVIQPNILPPKQPLLTNPSAASSVGAKPPVPPRLAPSAASSKAAPPPPPPRRNAASSAPIPALQPLLHIEKQNLAQTQTISAPSPVTTATKPALAASSPTSTTNNEPVKTSSPSNSSFSFSLSGFSSWIQSLVQTRPSTPTNTQAKTPEPAPMPTQAVPISPEASPQPKGDAVSSASSPTPPSTLPSPQPPQAALDEHMTMKPPIQIPSQLSAFQPVRHPKVMGVNTLSQPSTNANKELNDEKPTNATFSASPVRRLDLSSVNGWAGAATASSTNDYPDSDVDSYTSEFSTYSDDEEHIDDIELVTAYLNGVILETNPNSKALFKANQSYISLYLNGDEKLYNVMHKLANGEGLSFDGDKLNTTELRLTLDRAKLLLENNTLRNALNHQPQQNFLVGYASHKSSAPSPAPAIPVASHATRVPLTPPSPPPAAAPSPSSPTPTRPITSATPTAPAGATVVRSASSTPSSPQSPYSPQASAPSAQTMADQTDIAQIFKNLKAAADDLNVFKGNKTGTTLAALTAGTTSALLEGARSDNTRFTDFEATKKAAYKAMELVGFKIETKPLVYPIKFTQVENDDNSPAIKIDKVNGKIAISVEPGFDLAKSGIVSIEVEGVTLVLEKGLDNAITYKTISDPNKPISTTMQDIVTNPNKTLAKIGQPPAATQQPNRTDQTPAPRQSTVQTMQQALQRQSEPPNFAGPPSTRAPSHNTPRSMSGPGG